MSSRVKDRESLAAGFEVVAERRRSDGSVLACWVMVDSSPQS